MKRFMIVISCLALISLACLGSAVSDQQLAISVPPVEAATTEEPAGAVYDVLEILVAEPTLTKVESPVEEPRTCARVVALEALHLRNGPSENDIVLAWLKRDDLVQVKSKAIADWWLIEYESRVGYARSFYLEEVECG